MKIYLTDKRKWHSWFAWYPVSVWSVTRGQLVLVWLETIECRDQGSFGTYYRFAEEATAELPSTRE